MILQLHRVRAQLRRDPHHRLREGASLAILALGLFGGLFGAFSWQQAWEARPPVSYGLKVAMAGQAWGNAIGLARFLLIILVLVGAASLAQTRHYLAAGLTRGREYRAILITGAIVTGAAVVAVVLCFTLSALLGNEKTLPAGSAPPLIALIFLGLHYLGSFLIGVIIAATFIGYGTLQTAFVIIALVIMRGLPLTIGIDTSFIRIDSAHIYGADELKTFLFWLLAVPILAGFARFVLLRLKIHS